jgi:hypothetical protein
VARYLISGIDALVTDVSAVLGEHGAESVGVDDIDAVPAACAQAGPASFDGYIQLPATFTITGGHGRRPGPPLFPRRRPRPFPGDVRGPADVGARRAAGVRDGRAAPAGWPLRTTSPPAPRWSACWATPRADKPEGLRVAVLGSASTPKEIALTALGRSPEWESLTEGFSRSSYADWRVELLGMMQAEM